MYYVQTVVLLLVLTSTVFSILIKTWDIEEMSLCLKIEQVPDAALVPRNANSKEYRELNYQWNTFNYIQPLAYIVPTKTAHVQGAVRCATKLGIRLVVKSGGHSSEKYSFGDDSTMVIDMYKIHKIQIDQKGATAVVGPGALIGRFQYYAWRKKLVTSTTHCFPAGIGGSALGGGIGHLSKKFGVMSDNILEMKMVNAAGEILKIDAHHNQDLFWALRGGGGGNFGIVTEFKFQLYDASNLRMTVISLMYGMEQIAQVFEASQNFCLENVAKSVHVFATFSKSGSIVRVYDINSTPEEAATIVQKFPPPKSKSIQTFPDYIDFILLECGQLIQNLTQFKTMIRFHWPLHYNKIKSYFVKKLASPLQIGKIHEVLKAVPAGSRFNLFSSGGKVNTVPRNASAFVHRDALYVIEVNVRSNDTKTLTWVNDLEKALTPLDSGESYQNFLDGTLTNYLQRYYGKNLPRLRKVKRDVDPNNFFNFPQSIPA